MKSGITVKEILIPKDIDMSKWACIACDQFTSEEEYWKQLKEYVGEEKSTLNLVYPEIYLERDTEKTIDSINRKMREYVSEGLFNNLGKGMVLTVRKTPFVERRIGIISAVDLEEYDYAVGQKPLVRATEGTITERIPPRLKIRKDAVIEFPHIMVLFDDAKREIAEELYANREKLQKIYDFNLNMGGGSIEGYFISDYQPILDKFLNLLEPSLLVNKYGKEDKFQFAVGDGNHSLATAKAHWENVKKTLSEEERKTHPARYCLAEFVNIYDEGIYFEPIFRLVYNVDRKEFIEGLNKVQGNFVCYDGEKESSLASGNTLPESITNVDKYVKEYIEKKGGKVDYIHGEENLKTLVKNDSSAVGILFDKMDKSELFKFVSTRGALPRKTFSMGEGVEKRYYLEGSYIAND